MIIVPDTLSYICEEVRTSSMGCEYPVQKELPSNWGVLLDFQPTSSFGMIIGLDTILLLCGDARPASMSDKFQVKKGLPSNWCPSLCFVQLNVVLWEAKPPLMLIWNLPMTFFCTFARIHDPLSSVVSAQSRRNYTKITTCHWVIHPRN